MKKHFETEEKMTLGQYISHHRKLNGMTQKDLAEKLNVSDKAISRWERDENAPDIHLLPVIADIFGVTCDELLRGGEVATQKEVVKENEKAEINEETFGETILSKTSEPREETVRNQANGFEQIISKFTIRNLIAVAITLLCPISIRICVECDLGQGLAYTIGVIFIIIGLLCEIAFYKDTCASFMPVVFDSEDVKNESKWCVLKQFENVLLIQGCVIISSIFATYDDIELIPIVGVIVAGTILIGKIIIWSVNKKLIRKGSIQSGEKEKVRSDIKLKSALILLGLLVVTGIIQIVMDNVLNPIYFVEGTKIETLDELKSYKAVDYEDSEFYNSEGEEIHVSIYWDENGNMYIDGEDGVEENLPLKAYDYWEIKQGYQNIDNIHQCYILTYLTEIIIVFIYTKRKCKKKMSSL